MSQGSCWKRLTIISLVLAIITIIINIIVYKFASLIIVANSQTSSVVLVADFNIKSPRNFNSTHVIEITGLKQKEFLDNVNTKQEWIATQLTITTLALENKGDSKDILNNHKFMYKIVPKVDCSNSKLVICAVGSRNNSQTRQTIRDTWGSYAKVSSNNATLIFFLGSEHPSTNGSESVQHLIDKEAQQFGDILQEEFVDHYNNLSLKSVSILKWVSLRCSGSQYVLKVDDDMYVNVPVLVLTLERISKSKGHQSPFIVGHVFNGASPIRNTASKWFTPTNAFNESYYPKYTSGTSYAMTTSAAKLLYNASLQVPVFWLEDVYVTGLCARKANVEVIHDNGFFYDKRETTGCSFQNQISGHRYTFTEIARIHKELYDNTTKCY